MTGITNSKLIAWARARASAIVPGPIVNGLNPIATANGLDRLADALERSEAECDRLREAYNDKRVAALQMTLPLVAAVQAQTKADILAQMEAARTIGCDVLPMFEVRRILGSDSEGELT